MGTLVHVSESKTSVMWQKGNKVNVSSHDCTRSFSTQHYNDQRGKRFPYYLMSELVNECKRSESSLWPFDTKTGGNVIIKPA